MAEITWHKAVSEDGIPKDRRLLLIGTPLKVQQAGLAPDIVVGHWNATQWAFVPVEVPYPRNGARPELKVILWAEIPEPEGIALRPLAGEDLA